MSEQLTFFTRRPAWGGAPPGAREPAAVPAAPGAREPSADSDAAWDAASASASINADTTIHDIVKAAAAYHDIATAVANAPALAEGGTPIFAFSAPTDTDSQCKPYSSELCPVCGEKMYHSTHCRELQKWVCEYHCNRCRYRVGAKMNLCGYSDEDEPPNNLAWMSRGGYPHK